MKRHFVLLSLLAGVSGCKACSSEPAAERAPSPPPIASPSAAAPPDAGPPPVVVGGGCTYAEQPGTCTTTAAGKFTFTGKVDGTAVTLKDNPIDTSTDGPAVGKSTACTIKFLQTGACTPCMFSLGSCGPSAWETYRKHLEK